LAVVLVPRVPTTISRFVKIVRAVSEIFTFFQNFYYIEKTLKLYSVSLYNSICMPKCDSPSDRTQHQCSKFHPNRWSRFRDLARRKKKKKDTFCFWPPVFRP
jgi:hypothetical protein